MKVAFDVMTKVNLEDYFVKKIVPESQKYELRDSRKTDTGLSHREHVGLVVLSYFLCWLNGKETYVPAINNKDYDDGVITDLDSDNFFEVEQVYVYEQKWDSRVAQGIIDALNGKNLQRKDSILLIFCNAIGDFRPAFIKAQLKQSCFKSVLIVGPSGTDKYSYNIILAKENDVILNSHFLLSINSNNGKCKITTGLD